MRQLCVCQVSVRQLCFCKIHTLWFSLTKHTIYHLILFDARCRIRIRIKDELICTRNHFQYFGFSPFTRRNKNRRKKDGHEWWCRMAMTPPIFKVGKGSSCFYQLHISSLSDIQVLHQFFGSVELWGNLRGVAYHWYHQVHISIERLGAWPGVQAWHMGVRLVEIRGRWGELLSRITIRPASHAASYHYIGRLYVYEQALTSFCLSVYDSMYWTPDM